ncbi:MAG: hydantoinase/oxoprolinase family protein [Candidatus Desulfofervidaceae bacterium]|nr:hydantoinase/oxoprolinase family protein [Candidatus Desulfofervidaceae bacterium]MDL1970567.1 hydantoinase/oxoprolinase family protein [Candidatus Desulfofervidaceae bacterium]
MRVAVDTGGTFTDIVYLEGEVIKANKLPSTPFDPAQAVLNGLSPLGLNNITEVIHGTTVGTNAFLERKGARTAFITTAGFEDILFIGRQARSRLYDFNVDNPLPIVFPEDCFGVKERVLGDGTFLIPLSEEEINRCLAFLKKTDIKSAAICFIHAYLYPHHETLLKKALKSNLNIPISISSEILPEFREFERASTTAINAYLTPVMANYLFHLQKELSGISLRIQQSNGGWLTAKEASTQAVHTVLSGPAGGVSGSLFWAQRLGEKRLITFDMGGTSTDVCLVDGRLPFTREYILDGFPLSLPVIDIHTVGAGGGSIAYLDAGGVLKVGPQSAGADPGPACYGKGQQPTVTDANLVLGRILPDKFLGGRMRLDIDRARQAICPLARDMGVSVEEAALGIIEVANVNMVRALRAVSLERGFDPHDFTLFCFGGAAGLHACALARELGVKQVMVPKLASVLSALGLLLSPPIKDFSRTVWLPVVKDIRNKIKAMFADLIQQAIKAMETIGFNQQDLQWDCFLDMRYQGQGYELTIPYTEDFVDSFHTQHQQHFGHFYPDFPLEIVTIRVRIKANLDEILWKVETQKIEREYLGKTKVYTSHGRQEVPMISWDGLKTGEVVKGPALVIEPFTTVWIEPDFKAEIKDNYTLVLKQ